MLQEAEKRRFPRIEFSSPIRYQIRGSPHIDNAVCDNISSGGIAFTGFNFIPKTTPIMLEINVLSRILHPIGKVAWTQTMPHSERNKLGIEFLDWDPSEKNYLTDYIDLLGKE